MRAAQKVAHRQQVHERSLSLREDGSICIAVVADTHSQSHPNALACIRELAPDAILHAGDIGNLAVLDELAEIAPLIAVRGNIDESAPHLPDVVVLDLMAGDDLAIRFLLLHIAVYGARIRAEAAKLAISKEARLIICGHSHVPFMGRDKGLTVFNAGSIGPRRFQLPIVFGVLRIERGALSMKHIDAETGQEWLPGGLPGAV